MRRVIVESPYRFGHLGRNIAYARAAVRDCILRGEAPIASHLLLTQEGILRDDVPDERARGIAAGHAWMICCHAIVVYGDFGISPGMQIGIDLATSLEIHIESRSLPRWVREEAHKWL